MCSRSKSLLTVHDSACNTEASENISGALRTKSECLWMNQWSDSKGWSMTIKTSVHAYKTYKARFQSVVSIRCWLRLSATFSYLYKNEVWFIQLLLISVGNLAYITSLPLQNQRAFLCEQRIQQIVLVSQRTSLTKSHWQEETQQLTGTLRRKYTLCGINNNNNNNWIRWLTASADQSHTN